MFRESDVFCLFSEREVFGLVYLEAMLQGCIVVAIWEYNKDIKVDFIGASSWRSVLGLQGHRIKREVQKQIDIDFVNKTYGLKLNPTQDDEADAICILTAYKKDAATLGTAQKDVPFKMEPGAF